MNDADFLAWMEDNQIVAIKRWVAGRVSVELADGCLGVSRTVSDALAKAKTGADNIRKVA